MDFDRAVYEICRLALLTSPKYIIQIQDPVEMNRFRSCSGYGITCELHYALDNCSHREVRELP